MKKDKLILSLDLQYCYGIKSLNEEIVFENSKNSLGNMFLLYASNGTMKTSLTKTIHDILNKDEEMFSKDPILSPSDSEYKRVVLINGEDIKKHEKNILIFKSYNQKEEKISKSSVLITNKELKKDYEEKTKNFEGKRIDILREIYLELIFTKSKTPQVKTIKDGLSKLFGSLFKNSYEDIILKNEVQSNFYEGLDFEDEDIDYKLIFSEEMNNIISNDSLDKIRKYLEVLKKMEKESVYFSEEVGLYVIEDLLSQRSVRKTLTAYNLKNKKTGEEFSSREELQKIYDAEIKRVFNDPEIKKEMKGIFKLFGKKELQEIIETTRNNSFFEKIRTKENYIEARKSYVNNKIKKSRLNNNWEEAKNDYFSILEDLKNKAENHETLWENVFNIFNERFSLPIKVRLKNKAETVLGISEAPEIEFFHKKNKNFNREKDIRDRLSTGESKALYLLKILFLIEELKEKSKTENVFILFDDIADSFDYKNKYALIEYLYDLSLNKNFKSLILTHSFDFFTSVSKRIKIENNKSIAIKNQEEKINFINIKGNIGLKSFVVELSDLSDLILSIPVTRALLEYENGQAVYDEGSDYLTLTRMLHYKKSTSSYDIRKVFELNSINKNIEEEDKLPSKVKAISDFADANYIQTLYQLTDEISEQEINEENIKNILIKNKILLCMSIRIKAESILKKLLGEELDDEERQLGILYQEYFDKNEEKNEVINQILRKATIMVPELIHIDLLNYSLMMDLSIYELLDLYKQVKSIEEINEKDVCNIFSENIGRFCTVLSDAMNEDTNLNNDLMKLKNENAFSLKAFPVLFKFIKRVETREGRKTGDIAEEFYDSLCEPNRFCLNLLFEYLKEM